MPIVMTDPYITRTYFIPVTPDKEEGVWVRPLTETQRNQLRNAVAQESGQDVEIAEQVFKVRLLQECLRDWKGFRDVKGEDIAFSKDAVAMLCRADPEYMANLAVRVLHVARFGELEEEKN